MSGLVETPQEFIPLSSFTPGRSLRLQSITVDAVQAERLREMGLCEGRCVSVLSNGERLIVGCGGCRIGLHRDLAHCIFGCEVEENQHSHRYTPGSLLRSILKKVNRKAPG